MISPKVWGGYSAGFLLLAGLFGFLASVTGLFPSLVLGIASFSASCLVPYFFRDPERRPPEGEGLVLSPADGKVSEVEGGKVGIFMSLWDVHVIRSPVRGRVVLVEERPGGHVPAFFPGASSKNARADVVVDGVRVRMIAGALARKVDCWVGEGQEVERGERIGMIRFGSRVEVTFPEEVKLTVKVGERVRAGETVLGMLYGP